MWEGMNNRRFPRIQTRCDIQLQTDKGSKTITATTENIGIGGVCIMLKKPMSKGDIVDLNLSLEGTIAPIQCKGKVVWVIEKRSFNEDEKGFDMGIEFVDISDWDKTTLRNSIEGKAAKKK